MKYSDKPRICDITTKEVSKKSYQPVPSDKAWQVEVVKELIDVRDNKVDLDSWQKELYDLSQYLFAFFKTREKKCCSKLFLDAYQMIYDTTNFEFDNISSILRRFNKCFFKAFANNINDKLKRFKDDKKVNLHLFCTIRGIHNQFPIG